jgi:hypothetical protein
MRDGARAEWCTACLATAVIVAVLMSAPVFGFRSKRGKLLDAISSRMR